MRIEVALMWLQQNNMKGTWRGDLFVVKQVPAVTTTEAGDEK